MARKSKVAIAAIVTCVLILAYVATYLVWSRKTTWNPLVNVKGEVWSFYRYPAGLMAMETYKRYYAVPGKGSDELWWKRERIPATIFRPLIWLDNKITGRMHYPDQYKGPVIWLQLRGAHRTTTCAPTRTNRAPSERNPGGLCRTLSQTFSHIMLVSELWPF